MKKTIGILAHVDSGKTTFSEQLLYHTGVLHVKDSFSFPVDIHTNLNLEKSEEKINEIRLYHGDRYENAPMIQAGDICAVTGFKTPICGSGIILNNLNYNGKYSLLPALKAIAEVTDTTPFPKVLSAFR